MSEIAIFRQLSCPLIPIRAFGGIRWRWWWWRFEQHTLLPSWNLIDYSNSYPSIKCGQNDQNSSRREAHEPSRWPMSRFIPVVGAKEFLDWQQ